MGLTSRSLLYVMAAVAVVGVLLTLWLWPRFAGRGPRALLGRLGMLAGTQLTVLATLGLAVNANFQFYASWHELLGRYDDAPAALGKWGDAGAAGPAATRRRGSCSLRVRRAWTRSTGCRRGHRRRRAEWRPSGSSADGPGS